MNEKVAKIRWRMRRGMLELDIIFEQFLKNHPDNYTDEECLLLESLLELPDPDLFSWLMGYESPTEPSLKTSIEYVQSYLNTKK